MAEIRPALMSALKNSMKAGDAARTSALRLILAKLKDADIAARPLGRPPLGDDAITDLLRGMIKARREAIALYQQGDRPELAAKEAAEIAVIEGFLPASLDEETLAAAVRTALAETGATSAKDMKQVIAALKATHGSAIDLAAAGPLIRTALASD